MTRKTPFLFVEPCRLLSESADSLAHSGQQNHEVSRSPGLDLHRLHSQGERRIQKRKDRVAGGLAWGLLLFILPLAPPLRAQYQSIGNQEPAVAKESRETRESTVAGDQESNSGGDARAAEELWQKALAAKGGLDAIKPVQTSTVLSNVAIITPQETLRGSAKTTLAYPDRICEDFSMMGQTFYQTLAKNTFWIVNRRANQVTVTRGLSQGIHMNPRALQMKAALQKDAIALFTQGSDPAVQKKPLEPLEGMPGVLVKLNDRESYKAYFDSETWMLKKLVFTGEPEVINVYSDYRKVGDIQIPFKVETFLGTYKSREEIFTDFQANAPIPNGIFDTPATGEDTE
ncbi:MAG: hypothetical protein HY315_01385 [Acidobacteria bacterium]|nr:hypothetical protein [Acidobacteriota bacterium]